MLENPVDSTNPDNPQPTPNPPAPASTAASGSTAAPVNTTTPVTPTDNGYHPHNIWGSVFKALGGGDRTEYHVAGPGETDSSGKPVPEGTTISKQVAPTKGQLGKSIIAAIVTGLAVGEQQRGPGAGLRAFGTGASATMGARSQADAQAQARAQADFKNSQESQLAKAQIFSTNAAALHNIREAEKLQGETLQGMIDRDNESLEGVDPSDIIAQDVPQDQAMQGLKSGQYGATTHNVYVTGMTQMHDDKGNPILDPRTGQTRMEATVTITSDKPVPLTASDTAKYAQYHLPGFKDQNPAENTQVPASKKRGWDQMVHSIENAKGIALKMGVKEEDFNKATAQPGAAKAFQEFSRFSTGDPFADLQKMEAFKEKGSVSYGARTLGILHDAFGADTSMKYHEQVTREAKEGDPLYKMENDPSMMSGEKLPGTISILQGKLDNPNTSPADKARVQHLMTIANNAVRLDGDKLYTKALAEANAKRDVDQKDIDILAAELVKPDNLTTIKDVTSMRGDQRARVFLAAKKLDPSFDEGKLQIKERFVGEFFNPNGKIQVGLNAANTFVKHTWDLKSFVDSDLSSMRGGSIFGADAANTALNSFEKHWGGQTYNKLMSFIAPVRQEYDNALKAGYAPTVSDEKAVEALFNPAATPKQIVDSAYIALQTITKRVDTTNSQFKRMVGQNVPGLYDEEAKDAMHHLGLDSTVAQYENNNFSTNKQPKNTQTQDAPPASALKENVYTTFTNGETWTLQGGKPVKVH